MNINELNSFFKRLSKNITEVDIERIPFFVEPKIDGVSISIVYKDGKISSAITRGDGKIGEEITQNIKQIKNIP